MEQPVRQHMEAQIHGGHLALIALCAVLLVGVTFMKNGFTLHIKNTTAPVKRVTYEQVRNEVLASFPDAGSQLAQDDKKNLDELALLDPSFQEGQVLGTSTGTLDAIPQAEQVLTPEVLNMIPVYAQASTTEASVWEYINSVNEILANENALAAVGDLASQDIPTLKTIQPKLDKVIVQLLQLKVPTGLLTYHRAQVLYYAELVQLAQAYTGEKGARDPQDVGVEVLTLKEFLDKSLSEIQTHYGVTQ